MRRMMILGLVALGVAYFITVHPSPGPGIAGGVSQRLTEAEMDCIVGGQASCLDEAVLATGSCLIDAGVTVDNWDDHPAETAECYSKGAYTLIACSITWFFNLFF